MKAKLAARGAPPIRTAVADRCPPPTTTTSPAPRSEGQSGCSRCQLQVTVLPSRRSPFFLPSFDLLACSSGGSHSICCWLVRLSVKKGKAEKDPNKPKRGFILVQGGVQEGVEPRQQQGLRGKPRSPSTPTLFRLCYCCDGFAVMCLFLYSYLWFGFGGESQVGKASGEKWKTLTEEVRHDAICPSEFVRCANS